MPHRIAELFELVEDHAIGPRATDFPALVVNFFDVRFAARRCDHLRADFLNHSNRSRLISSGRIATAVQPSSAESNAPPRQ